MKVNPTTLIITVVGLVAVCMSANLARAQAPDQARQLQQIEPVKTWPSKAKRWALIIGVDKYVDPQIAPLKGADNDARFLSDALVRYAGFPQDQVILLATDQPAERQPTRINILRRLSNLATVVPKDGLLLISFAGHGIERGGYAYLIPSDSQISHDISLLEESAVSVNRMKERIRAMGLAQIVVLLDACRNDPGGRSDEVNPLTEAYVKGFNFDVRNRDVTAFATIYATAVGQRAYEFTEKKQGYFTWALVEGLKGAAANENGEVTLANLIKYVQENVPKRVAVDLGSGKQQRPFSQMEGYKADELVIAVTNNVVNNPANMAASPSVDPVAIELAFWETIKSSNNPDDFKSYLDKYPDGLFAGLARSRAQPPKPAAAAGESGSMEMTYWNTIKDSKNSSDFKNYQTKFPNGFFADLASSRISALEAEERERATLKDLSVDDTTWLGHFKGSQDPAGLLGTPISVEFFRGGMFTATYNKLVIVPGFLTNDYKSETVKMTGAWRQEREIVTVQVSQPAADLMRLLIRENKIEGAFGQGNQLGLKKLLTKTASPGCDFRGFTVIIQYRKKDKIDRTAEATKVAEHLRSVGAEVELKQHNEKYDVTGLKYFNGQADIANQMASCLKDIVPLKVMDQGASGFANALLIHLQL